MRTWVSLIAAFFAVNTPALATPDLNIQTGVFLIGPQTFDIMDFENTLSDSTLSRQFSGGFSYGPLGDQIAGSLSADTFASFGTLKATISSGQRGDEFYPRISVYTDAIFQDTVSFLNTGSASGTAFLVFTIDGRGVSGPNSTGPDGVFTQTFGHFNAGEGPPGTQTLHSIETTNRAVNVTLISDPISFDTGSPVSIFAELQATMTLDCFTFTIFRPCVSWGASGTSNFGSTAVLTGIDLFDDLGNPITRFNIESESGTRYTAQGVVPEPSSIVLIGLGLVFGSRLRTCKEAHGTILP